MRMAVTSSSPAISQRMSVTGSVADVHRLLVDLDAHGGQICIRKDALHVAANQARLADAECPQHAHFLLKHGICLLAGADGECHSPIHRASSDRACAGLYRLKRSGAAHGQQIRRDSARPSIDRTTSARAALRARFDVSLPVASAWPTIITRTEKPSPFATRINSAELDRQRHRARLLPCAGLGAFESKLMTCA